MFNLPIKQQSKINVIFNLPMKPFIRALLKKLMRREAGAATLLALFMLALIGFIGATVLLKVGRLYNGNEKAQGWQEALSAAEAGADIAMANLRWGATTGATPAPTPFDTSIGWAKTTTKDGNNNITNTIYTYTTPHTSQTGEGTSDTWSVVTVDSPIGDNSTSPPSGLTVGGSQWYRIRSTGHARIPGLARASLDALSDANARHSNALRKFGLLYNNPLVANFTNNTVSRSLQGTLTQPEVTRTIEQIIQPKTPFIAALRARTSMNITGDQYIDSYDPTNSTTFSNGLINSDPTKRFNNGNVFVNSSASGALTIGSGEKVYGSAGDSDGVTNGPFTDPNHTIQSPRQITDSTSDYNPLPPVPTPTWGTAGNPAINGSVTNITKATTITINSDSTQNYYQIQNITAPLTVALGTDPQTGQAITTGTLNIWLTGTGSGGKYSGGMTPGGGITIPKGATVKIYVDNGVSFHPGLNGQNVGAINNLNQDPATFQLYGVGTFPGGNAGAGIDLHVGGSGIQNFYGTVYAPYRYVLMKYDGSTNYDNNSGYYGSFVANIFSTVAGSYHYDQALNAVGNVVDFTRVSYVEDPR
jgi:hypothetical protein